MNFDIAEERRGTNSIKWDRQAISAIAANEEAEPFWVADMDLPTEPHIKQKGIDIAETGIYGYPAFHDRLESAASHWLSAKHGWNVD